MNVEGMEEGGGKKKKTRQKKVGKGVEVRCRERRIVITKEAKRKCWKAMLTTGNCLDTPQSRQGLADSQL